MLHQLLMTLAVQEVRKSVESAAQGLKAVSDKIRYDSTIDDSIDVMEAFCDDMEFVSQNKEFTCQRD